MPRSLQLRPECASGVKASLLRNGFPSQRLLAEHLNLAQSTISHFLNGKPVDYVNFVEICGVLGQSWQDVAALGQEPQIEARVNSTIQVLIAPAPTELDALTVSLQKVLSAAGHWVAIAPPKTALQSYLQSAHYWLLLLTEPSLGSELLLADVQLARQRCDTDQKPVILPICVDLPWQSAPPFDLLNYLDTVQPWQWTAAHDAARLAEQLLAVLEQGRIAFPPQSAFATSWSAIAAHPPVHPSNRRTTPWTPPPLPLAAPDIPGGQMDVASALYIERPPIETQCCEVITQPGALIRIKAPRQMGKTSLMARILHTAQERGSHTVALSLQLANRRVLKNSSTFLQWLCASVSLKLGLLDSDQLAQYWRLEDIIGGNQSCKAYFEQYLLPQLSAPLTLGLDEVDRVFDNLEIADDFFGLLRALHEEAKQREIWRNFRLIVVHSTEVYIPLDINKSPFNVGLPIELPEFTAEQVKLLVARHQLQWPDSQVDALMGLVGGHPFLVRLALYAIAYQGLTLQQVVQQDSQGTSIYLDHLRRHQANLEQHPQLLAAFQAVIAQNTPVKLPSEQAFKLNSMGLVKLTSGKAVVRCQLYGRYFRQVSW